MKASHLRWCRPHASMLHSSHLLASFAFAVALAIAYARLAAASLTIDVWPDPQPAVRGHLLSLVIISQESSGVLNDCCVIEFVPPTSVMPLGNLTCVGNLAQVIVMPQALDKINMSVSCSPKDFTIGVSWGLQLQLTVTQNPNPADEGKPLDVTLNLTNLGPDDAHDLDCVFDADPIYNTQSYNLSNQLLPAGDTEHLDFHWEKFGADGTLNILCTSYNNTIFTSTIPLPLKKDAKIVISPSVPPMVVAGEKKTIVTRISNDGSGPANNLNCSLTINPEQVIFIDANETSCSPILDHENKTNSVECALGDLQPQGSVSLAYNFHVNGFLMEFTNISFNWTCNAAGLDVVSNISQTKINVQADIGITLEKNSSLTITKPGVPFLIKNSGPSYLGELDCNFTVITQGIAYESVGPSTYNCTVAPEPSLSIYCRVQQLPPAGNTNGIKFILGLKVEDKSLLAVEIATVCIFRHGNFSQTFSIPIIKETPPTVIPVQPADNTMVVVVTVIVAVGLLIVIAIWWRRRQERSVWEDDGLNPRQPSLNRFSERELPLRSDD